jgi:hypothetical protein
MAKLGEVLAANRYEALVVGPRLAVTYETQAGQPVDGSSKLARELSPFQIRLLPPDALLAAADAPSGSIVDGTNTDVGLISASLVGSDKSADANELANTLSRATAIQVSATGQFENVAALKSLLANGKFLQDQGDNTFPTIADATTAADIALQVQAILEAPPLILLVNPSEFSINYTKIQNYGTRTRYGFIFESWGEEQPTMSINGSTGAFIAGAADSANVSAESAQFSGETASVSGVQFASKRDSAAWQNLMALYTFYRNNGYIYDTVGESEAHLFIGAVAIDYDQWTYVGHFESFSYSYDEGTPNRIEWSAEFVVSRMYDWASSPSVVLPQTAPTQSWQSGSGPGNRSPGALTLGQLFGGRARVDEETNEEGHVPLELLGGF